MPIAPSVLISLVEQAASRLRDRIGKICLDREAAIKDFSEKIPRSATRTIVNDHGRDVASDQVAGAGFGNSTSHAKLRFAKVRFEVRCPRP